MNPLQCKLGKAPARHDARTLRLGRYLSRQLPAPPVAVDFAPKVEARHIPWGMLGNDAVGDCTCAAAGHMEMIWLANLDQPFVARDADIVQAYSDITGYSPSDAGTDGGAVVLDVLNYWRQIGIAGRRILGFAKIEPRNFLQVKQACWLFEGVYIGLQLPLSAQDDLAAERIWDVGGGGAGGAESESHGTVYEAGSWGGHAVNVVGYDAEGVTCVTWGKTQKMTWSFWANYCVTPETRILTEDLKWVQAGELEAGDKLVGFDEHAGTPRKTLGKSRLWRSSVIESINRIMRPCYRLTFDDSTTVTCSEEHQWLTAHGGGSRWLATKDMVVRDGQGSNVVKPVDTWNTELTHESGYLAAALDGEGCLVQKSRLNDKSCFDLAKTCIEFAQKDNAMLARVEAILREHRFNYSKSQSNRDVNHLRITRRKEVLRLLGSIRPSRLLPKFNADALGQMSTKTVKLIKKEFLGMKEVCAIKTTSRTYIAEGLASHNCDEAYAILSEDMLVDGDSPAGFDLPRLRDELAAIGELPPQTPAPMPVPGVKRLLILVTPGLGTDPNGDCCGMRALAEKIAAQHPDHVVTILAVGWDQKPPAGARDPDGLPYTAGPDGLSRWVKDSIIAWRPTKLVLLAHSFGGAYAVFFMQWLWNWYSGPKKDAPPFVFDEVVLFDPVPNLVRFGAGQGPGWYLPLTVAPRQRCFYQRDGLIWGIKGEPLFEQGDDVKNCNVSELRDPRLGHTDWAIPALTCLIKDPRMIRIIDASWKVGA